MNTSSAYRLPVTIDTGLRNWQVLQQDENGVAGVELCGTWWTINKRRTLEVRLRIVREGRFSAVSRTHDWVRAETIRLDASGKSGTWAAKLENIPRGGPYRLETSVGSAEDALEWRRAGQVIHFFGVGDIWLIAGQSNAEGYGRSPLDDMSEIGVHEYIDTEGWQLAAHGSRHHPWLAFAKQLKADLGYPVGLIPTAVGGSPVSRWDPAQKGDLFADMRCRVQEVGGRVKGCLWYQGESDATDELCEKYAAAFTRFAEGVRQIAGSADLPIITVQLNRVLGNNHDAHGWERIREIQRQLSHELDEVYIIPAFEAVLCDGIHNGSLGNLLISQRAADTALGAVYGRDILFRHPECRQVKKISSLLLELHFDNVVTRLDYTGGQMVPCPFAVRDQDGQVPVMDCVCQSADVLHLKLGRKLSGPATVTGAPGTSPPHIVPRDINGYRGMLAFTTAVE